MKKTTKTAPKKAAKKVPAKPKLAVWKFSSCDGCQLSLLACEDELLAVTERIDIAYFLEATRAQVKGPYDISLVEGSITTAEEEERIHKIRRQSKVLITIGACATAGGIQALKNFADVDDYVNAVYAHPEFIKTLQKSTPISDHVKVDLELRGCPISKTQLLELLSATFAGRKPNLPDHSQCMDCKMAGNPCVMVTKGEPCLGPITHAGCNALCPTHARGCYGCFGPKERANTQALSDQMKDHGQSGQQVRDLLRTFNAGAEAFMKESLRHD